MTGVCWADAPQGTTHLDEQSGYYEQILQAGDAYRFSVWDGKNHRWAYCGLMDHGYLQKSLKKYRRAKGGRKR